MEHVVLQGLGPCVTAMVAFACMEARVSRITWSPTDVPLPDEP